MKTRLSNGQSLVETCVILAVFMAMLLGMIFVAQTLFVRQTYAERVHDAARWSAVNGYDPQAVRNIVRYGTPQPDPAATSFMGLSASQVTVANYDCPGPQCRVVVAIPSQGIRTTEPVEPGQAAMAGVLLKP